MAHSDFSTRAAPSNGPASRIVPVVPADSADLPLGLTRALFVGVGGVVSVVDGEGAVAEIVSADSQYHPLRVRRVRASATTATNIIALY